MNAHRLWSAQDLFAVLLAHQGYGFATAESPYWQGWRDCIGALLDLERLEDVNGPHAASMAAARGYVSRLRGVE